MLFLDRADIKSSKQFIKKAQAEMLALLLKSKNQLKPKDEVHL